MYNVSLCCQQIINDIEIVTGLFGFIRQTMLDLSIKIEHVFNTVLNTPLSTSLKDLLLSQAAN